MKSPSPVKARKMILLHEKSGCYSDYTLQPNATDAHFAKLAAEHSGRTAILSKVFVLPCDPAASEARVREGKKVANAAWNKAFRDWVDSDMDESLDLMTPVIRAVLSTLGLLASAKEKGKK